MALSQASESQMNRFNELVGSGTIRNRAGESVLIKPTGYLIDSQAAVAYPIQFGIPQLLPQLAISLTDLEYVNTVD